MTELLWQATLLLAVAFFFGAVFACGLKRRYYYGTSRKASGLAVSGVSHAPAPNQPKIEVAPRAVAEDERFNRAISGQSAHAAPAARQSAPAPVAKAPPARGYRRPGVARADCRRLDCTSRRPRLRQRQLPRLHPPHPLRHRPQLQSRHRFRPSPCRADRGLPSNPTRVAPVQATTSRASAVSIRRCRSG